MPFVLSLSNHQITLLSDDDKDFRGYTTKCNCHKKPLLTLLSCSILNPAPPIQFTYRICWAIKKVQHTILDV